MSTNKDLLPGRKRGNEFAPTQPATAPVAKKEEKKKVEGNVSLKVSPRTRATINALKDIKGAKNIDELLNEMIEKELQQLDDATRAAVAIIAKSKK